VSGFINTKLTLTVEVARDTGDMKLETKAKVVMKKRIFLTASTYHPVGIGCTDVKFRKLRNLIDDDASTQTPLPIVTAAKTPIRGNTTADQCEMWFNI
jgi:hypothetical protein